MTVSIDSIILYVQDVSRLKEFYTGIFGMEVIEEYGAQWVLLKAGPAKLGLHQAGQQYLENNNGTSRWENNCKIVFELQEDINTAREKLLAQKVMMKEIKTFDNYNYWLCDGEDPEGNVFQLKKRKA